MNRVSYLGLRALHRPFPRASLLTSNNTGCFDFARSRPFSGKTPDYTELTRFEDANPERIHGITVNPDSLGSQILPGNLVYKKYKWTGNTRKVPLELVHGYFWMMWDLRNTNNKPTLSNESLIPEEDAQLFPVLTGLKTLTGQNVELPFHFVETDKSKPAKLSLVAVSFRDAGFKDIASWTDPFAKAFARDPTINLFKVSITERWALYPLQGPLTRIMRNNTPAEEHESTLLKFGTDVDEFRDVLRMHNIMTNYVFLLDDLGRVRFAGSGPASEDEVQRMIGFAKELAAQSKPAKTKKASKRKNRR